MRKLRRVRCPECRRLTDWHDNPWRPFCSERCQLIDLGAWAEERYGIPGEPLADEQEKSTEKDNEAEQGGRKDEGASL